MKISKLVEILDAKVISMPDTEKEIIGGYCGDFLSFVMGKAPDSCAWFTIMNNSNVAAVATLADIGVIVICENVKPDQLLTQAVKDKKIALIVTELSVFDAARKM
jgi:hypothetical protein